MSLVSTAYGAVIGNPQNVWNFAVTIPYLNIPALLVQSTTLPSEQLQAMKATYFGEEREFPTKPKVGGDWSFNVVESEYGIIYRAMQRLYSAYYLQTAGAVLSSGIGSTFDIIVSQRTLLGVSTRKVILKDCYFKGWDAIDLKNDNVTGVTTYKLNFHYNWMKNVDPISISPSVVVNSLSNLMNLAGQGINAVNLQNAGL